MGYRLESVRVKNFRYIGSNTIKKFSFDNSDITILGGPNGYGKTTIFDAIELLLTGKIKHFRANLLNRGIEKIGVLANDINSDIVIEGTFYNKETDERVLIRRTFLYKKEFTDKINFTDGDDNVEQISQENLFQMLSIDESVLNVATYISQSESLAFLQQKFKDRKQDISALFSDDENVEKSKRVKSFADKFKELETEYVGEYDKVIKEKKSEIEKLEKDLEQSEELQTPLQYEKMFLNENEEYDFDKEHINTDIEYDVVMHSLVDLKDFINDYALFQKTEKNKSIDEILRIPENEFCAYYFRQYIIRLIENDLLITQATQIERYIETLNTGSIEIRKELLLDCNIHKEIVEQLLEKCSSIERVKAKLAGTQKIKNDLIEKRNRFLMTVRQSCSDGIWSEKKCPTCGFESVDMIEMLQRTELFLQDSFGETQVQINDMTKVVQDVIVKNVIPKLTGILKEQTPLLNLNKSLREYVDISTERVADALTKLNIQSFDASKEKFEFTAFDEDFVQLKRGIASKKETVSRILTSLEIQKYSEMRSKYYEGKPPRHKISDIEKKFKYIAQQYQNIYRFKLREKQKELTDYESKHDKILKKLKENTGTLRSLAKHYDDTLRKYQTNIANSIKIPLYLYSGRIIQNYPNGIGITAHVDTNQVVFRAHGKDCDAYNILSAGQLTGVMLSVLLAARSTFASRTNFEIMMIDDPLQTLDDISSISFVDLLTEQFPDTQIIFSTHEDEKAKLFHHKYYQRHRTVKFMNMKDEYLA